MGKKIVSLILAALLSGCASSGGSRPATCFHLNEAAETDIGYCQARRSGKTLHVSGIAGKGDMASAMRSVYAGLGQTLAAHGLTFADVVKENVYATDLDAFIRNKGLRKTFYGTTYPAATWVQVQRLYSPSLVLEVEVTAEFPE